MRAAQGEPALTNGHPLWRHGGVPDHRRAGGYARARAWRNHAVNETCGIVVDMSTWAAILLGILIGVVMAILF
jgi:hypothetical protein